MSTLITSNLQASNLQGPNNTGTAALLSSINSGQIAGMRNRIINGAMAIDQRLNGADFFNTSSGPLYTLDRWYAGSNGAGVSVRRGIGSGTRVNSYRLALGGASGVTSAFVGQRIEAINSQDMAGGVATLSVHLINTLLTTVTWSAYYANTTDNFGTLSAPTRTLIATGTFSVNSYGAYYSASFNVPAAATTGIEIVFSVGAQTSGYLYISDVQLEAGSIATPFERRSYGQELALCQRYYYAMPATTGQYGAPNATYAIMVNYYFPVTMRAAPTISRSYTYTYATSSIVTSGVTPNFFTEQYIASTNTNASWTFSATASIEL